MSSDVSDSSDEDYIPDKKEEIVSEDDSDSTSEPELTDSKKRPQTSKKSRKKKKVEEESNIATSPAETKELTNEEKKKKDDDLWADFMKDTGFQSKNSKSQSSTTVADAKPKVKEVASTKIKVTQVFEFAGEKVTVEKEVAKESVPRSTDGNSKGGISGILSQLGKKQKISTLEKSKLDWDSFKKEENLEDELQNFNKGKDGYLEKQDFLNRADFRRFEIEKKIRTIERNKRASN